ncbi:rhomboid family intramembrane serine protease [Algibacillus agarilyticus]|uniref:rhomboid family intramembrane serine protease n=1 Tax=Algibacillus agarilyticus TaxID=2234133 RepID=UPI0018E5692C|nr:rhomboid family intramembrane serine protease [Algibacillus agarilyticus]
MNSPAPNKEQEVSAYAIAIFENERVAQALADYLTTQDIVAKTMPKNNEIWVVIFKEGQVEAARKIADDFIKNPNKDKYIDASWQLNETHDLAYSNKGYANIVDSLKQTKLFTFSFIVVLFIIQLGLSMGFVQPILQALHFPVTLTELSLQQFYRLWSPALIHADWSHWLFNVFWFWWLGNRVEQQSRFKLINVCLLSGLLAHVSQYYLVGANFVGLSGVVYGLFAYVWFLGRQTKLESYFIPNALVGFMLLWVAIGFMNILPMGTANWAHLLGFVSGLALAWFESLSNKTTPPSKEG